MRLPDFERHASHVAGAMARGSCRERSGKASLFARGISTQRRWDAAELNVDTLLAETAFLGARVSGTMLLLAEM